MDDATGAGDRSLRWRYDVDPSEGDVTLLVTSTDREVIVHFATQMSERYGQCVETHASKTRVSGMPTGEPERSFPS